MKNNARINLKINEPNMGYGRRATDGSTGGGKDLDAALDDLNLE